MSDSTLDSEIRAGCRLILFEVDGDMWATNGFWMLRLTERFHAEVTARLKSSGLAPKPGYYYEDDHSGKLVRSGYGLEVPARTLAAQIERPIGKPVVRQMLGGYPLCWIHDPDYPAAAFKAGRWAVGAEADRWKFISDRISPDATWDMDPKKDNQAPMRATAGGKTAALLMPVRLPLDPTS